MSSKSSLSADLDDLLERYLRLLHTYTTLRSQISTHLSSGFLSLAQANYASSRHYGRDNYDGRQQATLRVNVYEPDSQSPSPGGLEFETVKIAYQTRPSRKREADAKTDDAQESKDAFVEAADEKNDLALSLPNPIRQFGVLVPQSLRAAQGSFLTGTEGMVELASTMSTMRDLEDKIRQARTKARAGP